MIAGGSLFYPRITIRVCKYWRINTLKSFEFAGTLFSYDTDGALEI